MCGIKDRRASSDHAACCSASKTLRLAGEAFSLITGLDLAYANKARFQDGIRYFMGEPVSAPHCQNVLRDGFQRQRFAAAQYLWFIAARHSII